MILRCIECRQVVNSKWKSCTQMRAVAASPRPRPSCSRLRRRPPAGGSKSLLGPSIDSVSGLGLGRLGSRCSSSRTRWHCGSAPGESSDGSGIELGIPAVCADPAGGQPGAGRRGREGGRRRGRGRIRGCGPPKPRTDGGRVEVGVGVGALGGGSKPGTRPAKRVRAA